MNEEKLQLMADFINSYTRTHGDVPCLSEIMSHMNMAKSTAYRYILELERRGIVTYNGKNTLDTDLRRKMKCSFRPVPIVGKIVCGSPADQEEYIDGYLPVPEEWAEGECFFLEAYGDSMTDAGIDKGDLILVRRTAVPKNGQIVVALTEEGNTLKRFFFEDGRVRLHAENRTYPPEMRDIYPEKLTVQGVAIKVIKDLGN